MKSISLLHEYFILLIMFLLVLEFIKCLWELIGLLSDYHNIDDVQCKRGLTLYEILDNHQ